ncbi:uncharacterized protein LOC108632486 [Ceratina calcarata]|uniref:Uncharacterized protein LOC108632486 n=1 Tax=Ceratina calcarata TaxID=156304 RepID=A0AAJ7JH26_9HYME|nr:uncharacterized protein LOC108632486 [Ceratina calcarata]
MESICALFVTLILVLPLVVQLQMLIADPKKLCTIFHYYASTPLEDSKKTSSPNILQHYTVEPSVFNAADSDSKILLTNLRRISSSPPGNVGASIHDRTATEATGKNGTSPGAIQLARHSSTFVKTDQVLPVVDIGWTYSSYRYKTFGHCLRNYYGDKYPPGEVVLNLMQLNLLDSCTNVAEMLTGGLFDFLKEEKAGSHSVASKPEIEYLNPLDHFVVRPTGASDTVERFTETDGRNRCHDDTSSITFLGEATVIGPVINGREKNQLDRRSSRKIEAPCKYYLSSSRRVYGTNDSRSGRNPTLVERGRSQTAAGCYGID